MFLVNSSASELAVGLYKLSDTDLKLTYFTFKRRAKSGRLFSDRANQLHWHLERRTATVQ